MSGTIITNVASFSARAMALAIDFALLAATHLFLVLILAERLLQRIIPLDLSVILTALSSYVLVFFVSFVFLHLVYFTLFHAWGGQTIGKMIMGLRGVTDERGQVPPAVAFLRWTGYLLSFFPLAAGFLWSAVDKDHCAWHDRLSQTRVVPVEMT